MVILIDEIVYTSEFEHEVKKLKDIKKRRN